MVTHSSLNLMQYQGYSYDTNFALLVLLLIAYIEKESSVGGCHVRGISLARPFCMTQQKMYSPKNVATLDSNATG